jgi:hypothetical protein
MILKGFLCARGAAALRGWSLPNLKARRAWKEEVFSCSLPPLKLKHRVPEKTDVKAIYPIITMRAIKYHLLLREGIGNFT